MKSNHYFIMIISLLLLGAAACILPITIVASVPTTAPGNPAAQAETEVAAAINATLAALNISTPGVAAVINTPLPIAATSSSPRLTVSVDTNCRTGPGTEYPSVGYIATNQVAEIVGRDPYHTTVNWIVRLPSNPSVICWVWGNYATVVGNTAGLPVYTPPPPPSTPIPTSTTAPVIPAQIYIQLKNYTGDSICYVFIAQPAEGTWGANDLPAPIPAGGSYTWVYNPGIYDIEVEDCVPNFVKQWDGLSLYSDTVLSVP